MAPPGKEQVLYDEAQVSWLDSAEAMTSSSEKRFDHAKWFISLRWIAIVFAGLLSVLGVKVLYLLPEEVWLPLLSTISVLAALNFLYRFLLYKKVMTVSLIIIQAFTDLVLLTFLVHFSGGVESPLVLLMIFHVIIAGITLSRKQCFGIAIAATIMIALLAWLEATAVVSHYTLLIVPHVGEHGEIIHAAYDPIYAASFIGVHGMIFLLTAFFVSSVAAKLRSKEEELEELAKHALRQHQLLDRSLETAGTGLFVCDIDLQPVLTNRRWEMWFADVESNENIRSVLLGDDSPLQRTMRDGMVRSEEIEAGSKREKLPGNSDGASEATFFQSINAPLFDASGTLTHVVQLVHDISDQKAAQAQILRAGKLAAVGELAGKVAHEVNNPIAIITTKSRILLSDHEEEFSDRTVDELKKIILLSDRVAKIAQGLLSYCRPSSASQELIDVNIPIRQALAMVEQKGNETSIKTEVQLRDDLPRILANEREMEQVFINLFLNAFAAMPNGGKVTVGGKVVEEDLDTASEMIELTVVDTGPGIPEDLRHQIFEPFFTTKTDGKGTGLGLSVCQGLIHSFGGTIRAEYSEHDGAVIKIRLPVPVSETVSK